MQLAVLLCLRCSVAAAAALCASSTSTKQQACVEKACSPTESTRRRRRRNRKLEESEEEEKQRLWSRAMRGVTAGRGGGGGGEREGLFFAIRPSPWAVVTVDAGPAVETGSKHNVRGESVIQMREREVYGIEKGSNFVFLIRDGFVWKEEENLILWFEFKG